MSHYLILAYSDITANALSAWLTPLGAKEAPRIVWERMHRGGEASEEGYETLVRAIEKGGRDGEESIPLNEVTVLVDSIRLQGLNAVAEGETWDSQVAMLILTFPEIRWIFGVIARLDDTATPELQEAWTAIEQQHSLTALLTHPKRCPLFDPSGLRNLARNRTNRALKENQIDDLVLSERGLCAAAIDEEKSYAYLHGYAAYRFGYRADVIMTWAMMRARFCNQDKSHGYTLLLEDMSLNLPDRPVGIHLLRLAKRAEYCPQLDSTKATIETSSLRILITTGQSGLDEEALLANRLYLGGKQVGKGLVIHKPFGGIFDLWQQAKLLRQSNHNSRKGNALDFIWPPPAQSLPSLGVGIGHGTPGKLLLIAEALIHRAEMLGSGVTSVADAVRGAVLATEALELTNGRTPTTAINALYLKHQFEVETECQFSGVEYHLKIEPRLDEIREEASGICRSFAPHQRRSAALNAEMSVICALAKKLRDHSQFDEEQLCLNRIRHLHNTLWMRQSRLRFVLWPVLRYLEILLSSFGAFVAMLVVWVVGLSILFSLVNKTYGRQAVPAFADAISSFFSAGPPITHSMSVQGLSIPWLHIVVACAAIISGFIHMGVFISHLYSMTSRR